MSRLAQAIATVGGVGYLRPAPGTWGSAAALPLAYVLHQIGGFSLFVMTTAAVIIIGIWATTVMTEGKRDHDPSEIVIDEVAGQFIALLPLSYGAMNAGVAITALWPGWLAAFALFRLFDITKPGLVGRLDRRKDPLGVMMDDVIAGIFAALCVVVLAGLAHGVMGW